MSRTLYYGFVFAYCCLSIYPFSLNIPEQESAKANILNLIPCPNMEFFSNNTFVFKEDTSTFGYYGLCFTVFLSSQISFFGGTCFYMLYTLDIVNVSAHSKKLQRKYFITICIQVLLVFFEKTKLNLRFSFQCGLLFYHFLTFWEVFSLDITINP
uniref:7TM_GPCR_Srx domain-containing protein n=1 Tax=Caenorhabditis tropicalis TaxID=1561998 RepID=A0A1I7U985_9PELO